jgi:hypothetical protein
MGQKFQDSYIPTGIMNDRSIDGCYPSRMMDKDYCYGNSGEDLDGNDSAAREESV